MFPLILQYWEKSRAALVNQLKGIKDSVLHKIWMLYNAELQLDKTCTF